MPYWVWLMAEGDGSSDWYGNDQGIVGVAQFISMGDPSAFELTEATTPAFRVNGTLVPEPTSAALLALASSMFLRRRHTRRFD